MDLWTIPSGLTVGSSLKKWSSLEKLFVRLVLFLGSSVVLFRSAWIAVQYGAEMRTAVQFGEGDGEEDSSMIWHVSMHVFVCVYSCVVLISQAGVC